MKINDLLKNNFSLYKRDERCLFLYVSENSDDFQIFLPSEAFRQHLYDLLGELTADHEKVADLDTSVMQDQLKVCIFTSLRLVLFQKKKKIL